MLTKREDNILRAIDFRNPEWIPSLVTFSPMTWNRRKGDLEKLVLRHPQIFPDFANWGVDQYHIPLGYRKGERYKDNWGCVWIAEQDGLEGQVVEHPLSDWDALDSYSPPDLETKWERGDRDWNKEKANAEKAKKAGLMVWGSGERLFDRLYFLRGFENLMIDIATDDPHLPILVNMLTEYEVKLAKKWLEIGVDCIGFHSDMATQTGLMLSPAKFRKYIKPMFMEVFQTVRKGGARPMFSSDGNMLEIVPDLIECGAATHDPQWRANPLPELVKAYKGKLCAYIDLDQQLFPFCKPDDIRKHVKDTVDAMYEAKGGMMIRGQFFDANTPLENIEAICVAFEDFCLNKSYLNKLSN